jgi:hypothetical protein
MTAPFQFQEFQLFIFRRERIRDRSRSVTLTNRQINKNHNKKSERLLSKRCKIFETPGRGFFEIALIGELGPATGAPTLVNNATAPTNQ